MRFTDEENAMDTAAVPLRERTYRDVVPLRLRDMLGDVNRFAVTCSTCKLKERCLAEGLDAEAMKRIDGLVTARIRLRKGETLFRAGDRFTSLYVIRSGSCKTVSLSDDGRDQIVGYHMSGDVIGTDGVSTGSHATQARSLEDTQVCVLSFERIEAMGRQDSGLQHNLHRLFSREIARERAIMMVFGMRSEQRLAAFLLDLSQRYHARGYSSHEFVLRLTREEIGSYLGLRIETVSRLLSRFQRDGLIRVQGRVVKLLDRQPMERLVDSSDWL